MNSIPSMKTLVSIGTATTPSYSAVPCSLPININMTYIPPLKKDGVVRETLVSLPITYDRPLRYYKSR